MDSSSEGDVEEGKEIGEMAKKKESIESKDSLAAGTSAAKGRGRSSIELLKAMGMILIMWRPIDHRWMNFGISCQFRDWR